MAVEVNISPIGSGFNRTTINTNFQRIDTALQDALSRSGSSPNTMSADIDLNGNDLLNVGSIDVESITIDGTEFLADEVVAKGDPGESASVTVGTVSTGAAGTDVIVTNSGDELDVVLNFTIPRGDTGASGAGSGDMLAAQNLNDVASKPIAFANIKQAATESATGVVELATTAEAATGTDTSRAVTPAGLTAFLAANPNALDVQQFTSNDTWTKPSSGTLAYVIAWGAGGSGGRGGTAPRAGGGGGGGARIERILLLSDLSATEVVTIGVGGSARSSPNTTGIAGGNTSFGSHLTAYGGGGGGGAPGSDDGSAGGGGGGWASAGGTGSNNGASAGAAGTGYIEVGIGGAGGTEGLPGSNGTLGGGAGGGGGKTTGTAGTNIGGSASYGAAGGGGGNDDSAAGAGGTSLYSGNGGAGATGANAATPGSIPGGGGGGSASGTSGAGARGELWVIVF